MKRLLLLTLGIGLWGCSSSKSLENFGTPHIVVRNANWEKISVAIAAFNFAKGRKLDLARPNELVLYDVQPDTSGSARLPIISKTVYEYAFSADSVVISSHLFRTHDLDDTSVAEDNGTATLLQEQNELSEIARSMDGKENGGELALPVSTQ